MRLAEIDHRLDGEEHAGLQRHAFAGPPDVNDIRFVMEHAAEAMAWTDGVMARLGLSLNRTKTCLRDARQERFDFRGYSFGPRCFRQEGRWSLSPEEII